MNTPNDHPRWMFKKNSMEFFIGLSYYLYYFTSGYTLKSHGQNVLWLYDSGHIVQLLRFPHYLYLDPIVHLDVVDQMPKCVGNYFLLGALITKYQFLRVKIYRKEYRKRELAVLFSFWFVFILIRYCY